MAQGKKKKSSLKKSTVRPAKKVAAKKKAAPKKLAKKVLKKKVAPKVAPKKATPKKAFLAPVVSMKKVDLKNFLSPLDDRLIVQLAERDRKTAGGLYIPDTVADVSGNLEGLIIAAGRGHRDKKGRLRPMDVNVGDRIIFPQYSGSKIEIQGEDIVILRESDVMGLLQK